MSRPFHPSRHLAAAMSQPSSIGVIVNPSAGRDVRRLVSWASVVPHAEKVNTVLRLLAAGACLGLERAWLIPDASGLGARVVEKVRAAQAAGELRLPEVRLLPMASSDSVEDSRAAAVALRAMGVGAIAVLGGDGTHRAVAQGCGEVPLLTLSTGTNNAFPRLREPTLAGMALGLYLRGRVPEAVALQRNKVLRVRGADAEAIALVDVVVSRQRGVGARAVYSADDVHSVYAAFAQANAIGLSSIAAYLQPVDRAQPWGAQVELGEGRELLAPLLPGVLQTVRVRRVQRLLPGHAQPLPAVHGTLAFDGEREWTLDPLQPPTIELALDGPRTLAVEAILDHAGAHGLLLGGR